MLNSQAVSSAARVLLPIALMTLAGCKSGAYIEAAGKLRMTNPHASLEYVGRCLEGDPENQEAIDLLGEVSKIIGEQHEAKVAEMIAAGNPEEALADCDRVIASAYLVRSMPGGRQIPHSEDERNRLAKSAAEKFYALGVKHQGEGNHREAATALVRTLGFQEGYRDAQTRLDESQGQATALAWVVCSNAGDHPDLARIVVGGVGTAAMERKPLFLQIVESEAQATVRCIVEIQTLTFEDSGWEEKEDSREVTVKEKDEQGVIYNRKKTANWTVFTRRTSCKLTAHFKIEDIATGRASVADKAIAQAGDSAAFVEWFGDKEAVPKDILAMPNKVGDPKDGGVLGQECARAVADDLGQKLFQAFK